MMEGSIVFGTEGFLGCHLVVADRMMDPLAVAAVQSSVVPDFPEVAGQAMTFSRSVGMLADRDTKNSDARDLLDSPAHPLDIDFAAPDDHREGPYCASRSLRVSKARCTVLVPLLVPLASLIRTLFARPS